MPLYEYRRPDGTTFEVLQKMSDPALTADPETGVPVERVFHPIAVHFKGKGFYNTDYGTRKRQAEKAASEASSSSSEGKGSTNGAGANAGTSSAKSGSSDTSSGSSATSGSSSTS